MRRLDTLLLRQLLHFLATARLGMAACTQRVRCTRRGRGSRRLLRSACSSSANVTRLAPGGVGPAAPAGGYGGGAPPGVLACCQDVTSLSSEDDPVEPRRTSADPGGGIGCCDAGPPSREPGGRWERGPPGPGGAPFGPPGAPGWPRCCCCWFFLRTHMHERRRRLGGGRSDEGE